MYTWYRWTTFVTRPPNFLSKKPLPNGKQKHKKKIYLDPTVQFQWNSIHFNIKSMYNMLIFWHFNIKVIFKVVKYYISYIFLGFCFPFGRGFFERKVGGLVTKVVCLYHVYKLFKVHFLNSKITHLSSPLPDTLMEIPCNVTSDPSVQWLEKCHVLCGYVQHLNLSHMDWRADGIHTLSY